MNIRGETRDQSGCNNIRTRHRANNTLIVDITSGEEGIIKVIEEAIR